MSNYNHQYSNNYHNSNHHHHHNQQYDEEEYDEEEYEEEEYESQPVNNHNNNSNNQKSSNSSIRPPAMPVASASVAAAAAAAANSDSSDSDEFSDCPLCMEPFDLTDQAFYPCKCGYKICSFCWNNLNQLYTNGNNSNNSTNPTDSTNNSSSTSTNKQKDSQGRPTLNGKCPACRQLYTYENIEFEQQIINKTTNSNNNTINQNNKSKSSNNSSKSTNSSSSNSNSNNSSNSNQNNQKIPLCDVRVLQRNLLYVVGLTQSMARDDLLRDRKYFGKFGRIIKCAINKRVHSTITPQGTERKTYSAYLTFKEKSSAANAMLHVNNTILDGSLIKATNGTTKYCSNYLRGLPCNNTSCLYLHSVADERDCVNKEDLAQFEAPPEKPPNFPIGNNIPLNPPEKQTNSSSSSSSNSASANTAASSSAAVPAVIPTSSPSLRSSSPNFPVPEISDEPLELAANQQPAHSPQLTAQLAPALALPGVWGARAAAQGAKSSNTILNNNNSSNNNSTTVAAASTSSSSVAIPSIVSSSVNSSVSSNRSASPSSSVQSSNDSTELEAAEANSIGNNSNSESQTTSSTAAPSPIQQQNQQQTIPSIPSISPAGQSQPSTSSSIPASVSGTVSGSSIAPPPGFSISPPRPQSSNPAFSSIPPSILFECSLGRYDFTHFLNYFPPDPNFIWLYQQAAAAQSAGLLPPQMPLRMESRFQFARPHQIQQQQQLQQMNNSIPMQNQLNQTPQLQFQSQNPSPNPIQNRPISQSSIPVPQSVPVDLNTNFPNRTQ